MFPAALSFIHSKPHYRKTRLNPSLIVCFLHYSLNLNLSFETSVTPRCRNPTCMTSVMSFSIAAWWLNPLVAKDLKIASFISLSNTVKIIMYIWLLSRHEHLLFRFHRWYTQRLQLTSYSRNRLWLVEGPCDCWNLFTLHINNDFFRSFCELSILGNIYVPHVHTDYLLRGLLKE